VAEPSNRLRKPHPGNKFRRTSTMPIPSSIAVNWWYLVRRPAAGVPSSTDSSGRGRSWRAPRSRCRWRPSRSV